MLSLIITTDLEQFVIATGSLASMFYQLVVTI